MSYQQELQAILTKYPELKEIKIVVEQTVSRNVVMPAMVTPASNLPPEIAAVVNAVPPKIDDGFEVTETKYQDMPKTPRTTTRKAIEADALKRTMAVLKQ